MIVVRGLRKSFGTRVLFRDADLTVSARDRVALVGPNGSGKTTLLEMVARIQEADAGEVQTVKGAILGYLPQETDALRGRTILDEVVSAAQGAELGHKLAVLEREIEQTEDADERDRLLAEYAHLQDRFAAAGGYTVEAEARRILAGLGFRERDLTRRTETLSGGWLMRVALAKLLLAAPDALLLDEPTNHLDLESVAWLERFLRAYEGAVLLVSHDRDLMNGMATKVVEIEDAKLVSYAGDYASFVEQRRGRLEQQIAAARNQRRRVEHMQAFIDRFRYKASKARQVQSRVKALERLERVEAPRPSRKKMGLAFPAPPRPGRVVVELRDVAFAYDGEPVYERLGLEIERGQKIALVGPNGAGKTTLLKLLAGVLTPQRGERQLGHNVALGYFAQHQIEALDPSHRVLEELARAVPPGMGVRARDLLGRFLFSGDDVDKRVSVLSGGERTRLALAKLLVSPVNVLCLDEPTNHLDIISRDVLEDALVEYRGAIVLITHDRHLIRSVANRILEVVAGRVRSFEGDYESYLWRTERGGTASASAPAPAPARGNAAKERRRAGAEARSSMKAQRDALRKVESELERVYARLAELEALLADPRRYASGDGVAANVRAYEDARTRVAELEAEWERLASESESGSLT